MIVDRKSTELYISAGAALASLVLSVIHLHFDPLPNPDAVGYLGAAQAWLDAGPSAAAAVYPLPLYSILIGSLHALTGFSLLTSAHCFDAVCIALLVVALQRLSRVFGADVRVQCVVVVLALLLPELNSYRSFLLRDFGYWLFATLSLTCLAGYWEKPKLMGLIGFNACCAIAAGFRLEAIPLFVAVPIALCFGRERRPVAALLLYVPAMVGVAAALFAALLRPDSSVGGWLAEIFRIAGASLSSLLEHSRLQLAGFGTHVLDPRFHDYAAFGLAGGLAAMIIVHVANAASLPLLAVVTVGIARRTFGDLDRSRVPVLWMAVVIALGGLAAVLLLRGIIQTRYAMPVALLIVVVAAFTIDAWYRRAIDRQARRRLRWLAMLTLVYFVAENAFALVNSKQNFVDTAGWLERHTPRDARIISPDLRIVYLADRAVDWRAQAHVGRTALDVSRIGAFDYLVVPVTSDRIDAQDEFEHDPHLQRVARFVNRHGNAIRIYRRRSLAK